jgi:hypothetical protein
MATSYTQNLNIGITSSQFSTREVIRSPGPIKNVWNPSWVKFNQAALFFGDTLTLNLNFDHSLQAADLNDSLDANEMIYWAFGGSGSLSANQDLAYQWRFTSVSGSLLMQPITGTGVLRQLSNGSVQGVINASQTYRELNLTDSSFTFSGIQLTLTIPQIASGWTPGYIIPEIASDRLSMVVPEPASLSLAGFGFTLLLVNRISCNRIGKASAISKSAS